MILSYQIETALHDCQRSPSGIINLESQSGDLKLKISLKYSKRDGTFKRHASKRSLAVFGKSIEKLTQTPSELYVYYLFFYLLKKIFVSILSF